jgi:hypothetical protein
MSLVTPMPSLVAAARGHGGLAALCLAGGVGAGLYAFLTGPGRSDAAGAGMR